MKGAAMNDGFQISGRLAVRELLCGRMVHPSELERMERGGEVRTLFETPNLILDNAYQVIAALLSGGYGLPELSNPTVALDANNITDAAVFEMRVTAQVSPLPPNDTDIALEGTTEFLWDSLGPGPSPGTPDGIMVVTFPIPEQVRFSGVIPATELIGTTLTEEGLVTASGHLIARTTFSFEVGGTNPVQLDHTLTVQRFP